MNSFSAYLSIRRERRSWKEKFFHGAYIVIVVSCYVSIGVYLIYDIVYGSKQNSDYDMGNSPGFFITCRLIVGTGIQSILSIAIFVYLIYIAIKQCKDTKLIEKEGFSMATKQQKNLAYKLFAMAFINILVSFSNSTLMVMANINNGDQNDDSQYDPSDDISQLVSDILMYALCVLDSMVFISKKKEKGEEKVSLI
ncbi:hypothetical protein ADUPG1_013298 [Aduncisulcus paluster]|uniref:Uncharacterized protein n=1 Tax=Aduncisulcus paluster TaxID=2918883 RepID=A0ABQ5K2F2_9EUKA|nr:hypothetical protein ADUPG1_013298 [Aduncisulcus paluster]